MKQPVSATVNKLCNDWLNTLLFNHVSSNLVNTCRCANVGDHIQLGA